MSDNVAPLPKKIGSVRLNDLVKGIYYAISAQIIALIYFGVEALFQEHPHFPTWAEWLPYTKAAVIGIVGYLIAKLGVNNVGQILQGDKPLVRVDANKLEELKTKAEAK